MPGKCRTCQANRETNGQVDILIVHGVSYRDIAGQFQIPKSSVARHAKLHVPKELRKEHELEQVARTETLRNQVQFLLEESLRNYRKAQAAADNTFYRYKPQARNACTTSLEQVRRVLALYHGVRAEEQLERLIETVRKEMGEEIAEFVRTGRGTYEEF